MKRPASFCVWRRKPAPTAALQVGAATSEVTVEGTPVAAVETQTNELAGTITGKEISQLQLNGRVFTQLMTLTPGVSNQTGSSEGQYGITANTNYSVNGGRLEYNNWELDGGDNMDNGSNATLNVTPSIDAIGEVRVLTSNYGAQYGRNASGTSKPKPSPAPAISTGTLRIRAQDNFNATPGFPAAGPLLQEERLGLYDRRPGIIFRAITTRKRKSFFFWSEEWRRDRVPGQNFNQCAVGGGTRRGFQRVFVPARIARLILVREIPSMAASALSPWTLLRCPCSA